MEGKLKCVNSTKKMICVDFQEDIEEQMVLTKMGIILHYSEFARPSQ